MNKLTAPGPAMVGLTPGSRLSYVGHDHPAPRLSPAPPSDRIYLSKIDTPENVALLPAFNTTVTAATLAPFLAKIGVKKAFHSALTMTLGASTAANLKYAIGLDGHNPTLTGQGTPGDVPFNEVWTAYSNRVTINGTIGNSAENLIVRTSMDGKRMSIDGKVGDVEIHEILLRAMGKKGTMAIDGTLGASAIHEQISISHSDNGMIIAVTGTLGDKAINGTVTASVGADKSTISLDSQGNVAGVDFKLAGIAARD